MGQDKLFTLKEIQQMIPLQQELIDAGKVMPWFGIFELSVKPEQLWPYLCSANRIEKETGIEVNDFTEVGDLLYGVAGAGIYSRSWFEYPKEWNNYTWIHRTRRYTHGIVKYDRMTCYLQRIMNGKGTRLYIWHTTVHTNPIAPFFLKAYLKPVLRKCIKVFKDIENEIHENEIVKNTLQTYSIEELNLPESTKELLGKIIDRYKETEVNMDLVNRLIYYLFATDETELYRIRIIPLAESWQVDTNELLQVFLYGVKFGLLKLTWDTICPHCRGVRHENPYLSQLQSKGTCEVCKIEFETTHENSIEVVFHIHPAIREIKKMYYCSGEPTLKAHIKVQQNIPAHKTEIIETQVPEKQYAIRIIGHPDKSDFNINVKVEKSEVVNEANPNEEIKLVIQITNPFDSPKMFILEEAVWDTRTILKPSYLFNNALFRDLFDTEAIPLSINLEVGTQTIMFIDLVRSTKFYKAEGDAQAFNKITKYFSHLSDISNKHNGAIVKFMGDGAMLAFNTPLDALQAGIAMQEAAADDPLTKDLHLCVAINSGKCLAVNFNTHIDYFGSMVNYSAKQLLAANPDDIILSDYLLSYQEISQYLTHRDCLLEQVKVTHRSLMEPLVVYRLLNYH